ncbi:MAG: hypothetical protein ACLVFM_10505 [Blautia faecis]
MVTWAGSYRRRTGAGRSDFYSYEQNGQFRNISHVAIYVGNGRMVHAANSRRGVVNDPFNPSNIGLYGRPSRLQ